MRLGEVLRSTVVDREGRDLGRVADVRLVQDGPLIEGFGASLRVDGLIVGGGGLATRLGYHRHGVRGPAILRWIFTKREQRARFVPWAEVDGCDADRIHVRAARDELPRLADAGLD